MTNAIIDNSTLNAVERVLGYIPLDLNYDVSGDLSAFDSYLHAFSAGLNWLALRSVFYALVSEHLGGSAICHPIGLGSKNPDSATRDRIGKSRCSRWRGLRPSMVRNECAEPWRARLRRGDHVIVGRRCAPLFRRVAAREDHRDESDRGESAGSASASRQW